ncbi:hypothetical protein J2Z69_001795 [Paenibacillus shirakamiensis]|uniref:Polymerase nucleotidyl transferase domain-containing protein n=1 Tax=Paenibacillus shirakamiensis TaxID=1265935 RepID=A0ABS4JGC4_9BACL|nr:nucleotidyltransferase domain-containing protein [Paenibacillus shirakamiensis]MBP2000764.1 hypothetical protein [Paenibacillus shirakamiensis]
MDSNHLLAIAEEIKIELLRTCPDILSIIVTGSLAKGRVDAASDIDIIVYHKGNIPEEVVQSTHENIIRSGGEIKFSSSEVLIIIKSIEGVKCEIAHLDKKKAQTVIHRILQENSTNLQDHTIVTGIHSSRVLYDHYDIMKQWKNELASYPIALAEALVKDNLTFEPKLILQQQGLLRQDWAYLAELKLQSILNLVGVLCGLNRTYHPGRLKRLDHTLAGLAIQPSHLQESISHLMTHVDAIHLLEDLIYETFDLVDYHMPSVSTSKARVNYEHVW